MKQSFLKLLRWDFLLLHRNNLVVLALAIATVYFGIFKLLEPLGDLRSMLLILVFNDPVVTGLMFAGVIMLFEKNQHTLQAIGVSPRPVWHFLLSKVISLSLLATFSALLMNLAAIGWRFNWFHFVAGVFFTSALFAMAGIYYGNKSRDFTGFLVSIMGLILISALPFLSYFGLIPGIYMLWLPQYAGMLLLKAAYFPVSIPELIYAYAYLLICLLYAWKQILKNLKLA